MKKMRIVVSLLLCTLLICFMASCNFNGTDSDGGDSTGNNNGILSGATGEIYQVTYHIANNDNYLASLDIENINPTEYDSGTGLTLNDLIVPGYSFKGWYTAQIDGSRVDEITAGSKGNKVLYAQWEKIEYTITFDSPDVPVESVKYTVDTGAVLKNAEWYGYTFVGWSDSNGFIVTRINPGTTGNIVLHANWTSNRNKATSYESYGSPIIIEDAENGRFLFVYDIGKIDNVPLYEIKDLGNTQRLEFEEEFTIVDYISSEQADEIREAVMSATTNSSGWVLSEEWNSIYSEGSEAGSVQIKTEERVDSQGNVVGGQYFVSNSSGGSSYTSMDSGASSSSSSKVTTDTSFGINASYDKSTEKYADAKLYANNTTEASAGVSFPVDIINVSAGVKNTTSVGTEITSGRKDNSSFHIDGSYSNYVGTVDTNDESSYYNATVSNSSTWNSQESYTNSYQTSIDTAISNAISDQISKTTSYGVSESLGGENSKTSEQSDTESKENEYSSTFKYSEGTSQTSTEVRKFYSDMPGYYRIVMAGTVHVYAVVGYDVATSSYYTYTYSVLDDERHTYLDYSKDNANFDDCENGIITFEIPYEVNEYVMGVTGQSSGLEFDLNGTVTDFEAPEKFDGHVVVPQYYSSDNLDGTYSANCTLSFDASVFRGNTEITTVVLPVYVTEIPDNAFEGCTSLETVIAYGVVSIGNNAFKGCTSLKTFGIDNKITYIGENAFEGVNEISVMAANPKAAMAAINSGAKRITLDITKMSGELDGQSIVISNSTEFFKFIGGGRTVSNLTISSDAKETFISNITLVNNVKTPVSLNSATVTLARVEIVAAPGFAIIFKAENTTVRLYDTIQVSSSTQKTVLSKNIEFAKAGTASSGVLAVSGEYLICGSIANENYKKYLSIAVTPQVIDENAFADYANGHLLSFDANGGNSDVSSRYITYGEYYGSLPIPTRDKYTFGGWYTSADGGTQVTEDTICTVTGDQTLYAHWTYNSIMLNFDANGGWSLTSYKILTYGQQAGELPVPTRDYYNFVGWYDADGIQITADTVISSLDDITVTAYWELKPVQGWTKIDEAPVGAEIVDLKYTYTQTYYTTSDSSELEGWKYYDTTYSWSEYGEWSGWTTTPLTESDTVKVEKATLYGYYYYLCSSCGDHMHGYGNCYTWAGGCGATTKYGDFKYIKSKTPYSELTFKEWYGTGKYYTYLDGELVFKWVDYGSKVEYRYCERTQITTYHFYKTELLESATEPEGENISELQQWVQYREK